MHAKQKTEFARARRIERLVCEKYFDEGEEVDAADLALDELHTDAARSDEAIANAVAMRISFP